MPISETQIACTRRRTTAFKYVIQRRDSISLESALCRVWVCLLFWSVVTSVSIVVGTSNVFVGIWFSYFSVCSKVVQEYERAAIFRLGRALPGARGPGQQRLLTNCRNLHSNRLLEFAFFFFLLCFIFCIFCLFFTLSCLLNIINGREECYSVLWFILYSRIHIFNFNNFVNTCSVITLKGVLECFVKTKPFADEFKIANFFVETRRRRFLSFTPPFR